MRRFLSALLVWLLAAVVFWLVGQLFLVFEADVMVAVGNFLDRHNVLLGFLVAVWYYFFGPSDVPTARA